jgi:hypothetical protein
MRRLAVTRSMGFGMAAAALALAATLCGRGDEAADKHPAESMLCPQTAGGQPAPGAFDARELLGQPESAAQENAKARRCRLRVVERDGARLDVTADLRGDRINVSTRDGIVVRLDGVY